MKTIILLFLMLISTNSAYGREAGWVPLPKSPDESLIKNIRIHQPKGVKEKTNKISDKKKNETFTKAGTVYDNQPPVTEKEILSFVDLLPKFRSWARQNGEEAHPVVAENGKPDFVFSPNASQWLKQHNFNYKRFFCIMGKMAAGMVIVEEGNDFKGTRPKDMPEVSQTELELVRKHMGELLNAGRNAQSAGEQ